MPGPMKLSFVSLLKIDRFFINGLHFFIFGNHNNNTFWILQQVDQLYGIKNALLQILDLMGFKRVGSFGL